MSPRPEVRHTPGPQRTWLNGFQERPDWHWWKRSRKAHVFDAAGDAFVSLCGRAAIGNEIRRALTTNPPQRCVLCSRLARGSGPDALLEKLEGGQK